MKFNMGFWLLSNRNNLSEGGNLENLKHLDLKLPMQSGFFGIAKASIFHYYLYILFTTDATANFIGQKGSHGWSISKYIDQVRILTRGG